MAGKTTDTGYINCVCAAEEGLLINAGSMEDVGTTTWTAANAAALTKTATLPHSGLQSLRVTFAGTANPYAYQAILTIGKKYRIYGWARGDAPGTAKPYVENDAANLWQGTTSATWQYFDVTFTAAHANIGLMARAVAAGYADFDDVVLVGGEVGHRGGDDGPGVTDTNGNLLIKSYA